MFYCKADCFVPSSGRCCYNLMAWELDNRDNARLTIYKEFLSYHSHLTAQPFVEKWDREWWPPQSRGCCKCWDMELHICLHAPEFGVNFPVATHFQTRSINDISCHPSGSLMLLPLPALHSTTVHVHTHSHCRTTDKHIHYYNILIYLVSWIKSHKLFLLCLMFCYG